MPRYFATLLWLMTLRLAIFASLVETPSYPPSAKNAFALSGSRLSNGRTAMPPAAVGLAISPFQIITPRTDPSASKSAAIPATIGFLRDQRQSCAGGETGRAIIDRPSSHRSRSSAKELAE